MRTLYHFTYSPFSRRTRLALAHKGLECELREAGEGRWREEAGRQVALKTIPVLVDGDVALADSSSITRWLDATYPDAPRIWPDGEGTLAALEVTTWVDTALDNIVNVGTRYYSLREHPSFLGVKAEMLGRAQRALDALGARAEARLGATLTPGGWSAADMWLYTASVWFVGLPQRVNSSPNAAQIMALGGWTLPEAIPRWAQTHHARADVQALG